MNLRTVVGIIVYSVLIAEFIIAIIYAIKAW